MICEGMTKQLSLTAALRNIGVSGDIADVVTVIATACQSIAVRLRNDGVSTTGVRNNFGDDVLSVDMMADQVIAGALSTCGRIAAFASEERPTLIQTSHAVDTASAYTVTYDPLDGSSIVESNFAVGSIFGVWPGRTPIGLHVRDMVASVVVVYGPRTVLLVGQQELGVAEFFCRADGQWQLARRVWAAAPTTRTATLTLVCHGIGLRATVFSPGNLRAARYLPWYRELITAYMRDGATLRYTGGMVPDVCRIIMKGDGIYMTPASPHHKVKLRLLFEVGPMAFLIHCAGGRSSTGLISVMDVRVDDMEQTSAVALGCTRDVERYERLCRLHAKSLKGCNISGMPNGRDSRL
uniref:fructose-bisphosphatase n=1 Tax=Trypanosoma congolense (strain IL3000) TaxID=1068625 RepID=G0UJL6_TRYCI|nr:putative sedoheptulose-1,7-bisphosphatase [Trypanosoma congolense IL3000]